MPLDYSDAGSSMNRNGTHRAFRREPGEEIEGDVSLIEVPITTLKPDYGTIRTPAIKTDVGWLTVAAGTASVIKPEYVTRIVERIYDVENTRN